MSNSIVTVRENPIEDSLILIIGEDGLITPDKQTVQKYLKSRHETELKIMQVNKSDGRVVDVTVDHMTYISTQKEEVMYERSQEELDQIAKSLYSFRLDHAYTSFIRSPPDLPEIDKLDETLSLLEGTSKDDPLPPELVPIKIDPPKITPPKIPAPRLALINKPVVKNTKRSPLVTPNQTVPKIIKKIPLKTKPPAKIISVKRVEIPKPTEPPKPIELPKIIQTPKPAPTKIITSLKPLLAPKQVLPKPIEQTEEKDEQADENYEEPYSDDDFAMESDDDANDLDFEIEKTPKTSIRLARKSRSKSQSEIKATKPTNAILAKKKVDDVSKVEEPPAQPVSLEVPTDKPPDKKVVSKKEKKPPKPLPNDFMLFSTPDIIRRVGGKQEAVTPTTPSTPPVFAETFQSLKPANATRLSTETKEKRQLLQRTSIDSKTKDRRPSSELKRQKSVDDKSITIDRRLSSERKRLNSKGHNDAPSDTQADDIPSAKDIRAIIQNENTKSFTTDLVIPDTTSTSANITKPDDDEELNLTIDNIDELLYKVAETLADDKEFQSAFDKSLDENLLNTSISSEVVSSSYSDSSQSTQPTPANVPLKGTQVIRADGRVVVIPPIERPTTRSRNKAKTAHVESVRTPVKTFDDKHVSGGELDSTSDDDRSDDDPEKLWCICNQPHNNRFMICCDHCEEWYHGKCVNVTKQMGQTMEKEGKEWICLYCKDLSLKRPAAAARRVRKASRNSATGSVEHNKEPNVESTITLPAGATPQKVQGCIVCRKPCRNHSIFCSDACIVQNAKDVEKVVVFERSTGKLLSGNDAPTAANLEKWLKKHPGFEVVRSKANVTKQPLATSKVHSPKLQIVKQPHRNVSLALQKRGVHVGLLKQSPKQAVEIKEPTQPKVQQIQPKALLKVGTEVKVVKKPLQVKIIQPSQMVLNAAPIQSASKRRKSVQKGASVDSQQPPKEKIKPKTPKAKPAAEALSPEKKLENIRDSVKKSLSEQLTLRIQSQNEIKLNKDEVAKISYEIESQLFKCFGDTGQKYRNKYRSLMFNIKDVKNQTLWQSICKKTVNPYQLVRLSPDELASQELALWRERENKHQLDMITKNELDQLGRPKQFVIKTHKGEQEVEDNRVNSEIDKTEMVTGIAGEAGAAVEKNATDKKIRDKDKKRSRSERDKKYNSISSRGKSERKNRKYEKRSLSRDRIQRRRSRSRSKGNSRHLEKHRSRSRDRHRRSHKTTRHKKSPILSTTEKLDKKSKEILDNLVDNKIVPPLEDKLWKHVTQEDIMTAPLAESDSDHEPTSTVIIPTPPHASDHEALNSSISTSSVVNTKEDDEGGTSPPPKNLQFMWSGIMSMIDVAELSITAHEVSGDCAGLGEELPQCLDVVGRIPPDTVWEYISKMKSSNSKAIALLRLNSTSIEAQIPYIALYSYLQSRNRLGVVKSYNKAVKDFYVLPLASHMPIPQALLPLSGPSFEESRPALLLGIIVRDNRKRPLFTNSSAVVSKRFKIDTPITPPVVHTTGRSYTPPPTIDVPFKSASTKMKPIAASSPHEGEEDMDEPYSPKDSDPDVLVTSEAESKTSSVHLSSSDLSKIVSGPVKSSSFLETSFIEPFSNKFDAIPGLDTNPVLLEKQQLQREMEDLDQQIARQKAEIQNMSQNIASTSGTRVGGTLSNIELPSNIQQILDSIKTPQSTNVVEGKPTTSASTDLTIPLMLPKLNSRNGSSSSSSPTIPLNLPKYKNKNSSDSPSKAELRYDSYNKPTTERSVLSTLSDEDLIRKANEMMKAVDEAPNVKPKAPVNVSTYSPPQQPLLPVRSATSIRLESNQPPIPGLD